MKRTIRGKVIYGDGFGAPLGYPTANLRMPKKKIASGVYVARVRYDGAEYKGLVVVGMPSGLGNKPKLEVHILDFKKMIYGDWLSVRMIKKLRPLKRFRNRNLLLETIEKDCNQARNILG